MTLTGTRFGAIDYEEGDVLTFAEGLIGFENLVHFLLLSPEPDSPFRWLQSMDEPTVAFLVAHPERFVSGYEPEIDDQIAEELAFEESTPRIVFTTASIPPGQPEQLTLNLAGPILINAVTRCGRQVVLDDAAYTIKHRVFPEANQVSGRVAA